MYQDFSETCESNSQTWEDYTDTELAAVAAAMAGQCRLGRNAGQIQCKAICKTNAGQMGMPNMQILTA